MSITPTEWLELREHLRNLRRAAELAVQRATHPDPDPQGADHHQARLDQADKVLRQLEQGLHPVCEVCGERVEVDRLRANPLEGTCWSCGARELKAGRGTAA